MSKVPASPTCPVIADAQSILTLTEDLYKSLRRFRIAQARCKHCAALDTCEPIKILNNQINNALATLTDEWNLTL